MLLTTPGVLYIRTFVYNTKTCGVQFTTAYIFMLHYLAPSLDNAPIRAARRPIDSAPTAYVVDGPKVQ